MKKVVVLLLFMWFFLQTGQVVSFFFSENTSVFIMSEEKVEDNAGKIKKDNKDFTPNTHSIGEFLQVAGTPYHFVEKIHLPPYFEKLSPPPNFC